MICPNHNDPRWKALVDAVGTFEAYRDWMEHNNEVRDPDLVKSKLETVAYNRSSTPLGTLKKELGISRKEVSDLQKNMILKRLGKYNQLNGTSHSIDFSRVGQADLYTWEVNERWNGYNPKQLVAFSRDEYSNLSEEEKGFLSSRNSWTKEDIEAMESLIDSPVGNSSHLNQLPFNLDPVEINKTKANEIASKLAQRLSLQHGVEYLFVSPNQAAEYTKDTKNPWNGEPAFFLGDTIYFVGDHMTTNMVFHEFAHPILRSLSISNPVLFDNLYNNLSATEEGRDIVSTVESLYPDLDRNSDLFKEEVLVRATADKADASKQFSNILEKIFYHIKQLLRKLFKSKINVEKLSPKTTIDQLGDMLANDEFKIDTKAISQEDLASYIREQKEHIENLKKYPELAQRLVDSMYQATLAEPVRALEKLDDEQMLNLLKNELGADRIKQMRANISKFRTEIRKKMGDQIDETKYLNNQTAQFVSSLFLLKDTMEHLSNEIKELKDLPESKENTIRAQYIAEFTKYWEAYVHHVNDSLRDKLPSGSPLRELISDIQGHIGDTKSHIDPIFKKGLTTLFSTVLTPMKQRSEQMHADHITKMKAKGASTQDIKREEQNFKRLQLSPELISAMLSGYSDANRLNNWLEPWMYSSDLVVGGFAAFLKNTLNDVLSNSQSRWGDFVNDVVPLAEKAGYNPTKIASLADKITFTDSDGLKQNEDGTWSKREVYSFLTPFKDYRYTLSKLRHDITEADKLPDRTLYNQLIKEERDLQKWFWRDNKDEFYDKDSIFDSEIGQKARSMRDDLFAEINQLEQVIQTEEDFTLKAPEIEELRKRVRQLYSLKDLNDEYKTGEDLEVAKILQQSREINRHFYEYKLNLQMFQGRLAQYEQQISEKYPVDSEQFNQLRQEWLDRNTVVAVKPEFYELTSSIYDQIRQIYESVPNPSATALDLAKTYADVRDTISAYRDDDGQPVGSDMSPKTLQKIKDLQEKAIKLQKELRSGMSEDEQQELDELFEKINNKKALNNLEQDRFDDLMSKGAKDGLNKFQRARLAGLWSQLSSLQGKEPTEYYLDVFNNYMSKAEVQEVKDLNKVGYADKETADYIINLPVFRKILKTDSQFEAWFNQNHIRKEFWDPSANKHRKRWERISAWSVVRPLDSSFMESTPVIGPDGVATHVSGKPSMRFYTRNVKPEWKTDKILGKTKDIKGNWLPKTPDQGAPDERFVNHKYYDLKNNDPDMFNLLEKIKEHYLQTQAGADRYAQLGYDIPRFRKEGLEVIQTPGATQHKINSLQAWFRNIKAYFTRAKDDPDMGYNPHDDILLAEGEFLNDRDRRTPVPGIYDLDIKDVSQDIFMGIAKYMSGVEKQKKLKEIHPLAKALKSVLENPDNYARDMHRVNKLNFNLQYAQQLPKKKGTYVRQAAVNNLMDREFYGQQYTGLFHDNKTVNALTNLAFKGASFSYLAVQLPSAVTNMLVQMVQNVIESASGENFNPSDLAYGTYKGTKTMTEISMEIYKVGSHSLEVQKTEIFDAVPGRTIGSVHQQKLGSSLSRTFLRDAVTLDYLYSPRKWMENEATLQAYYAMMNHIKVKQVVNGSTKEITYDNAWELDKEGKIKLKDGIDPTYAQGGDKFNEIRNRMEIVQYKMNGAYDHFGQPEAQRYLIFRLISFLRRYVTTMLTNRWGVTRHNPGMMDVQTGYYIESMRAFWKGLTTAGKYFTMMSPSEQGAFRKLFAELGILTVMHFMYGLMFGWDPNDDDKYNKLRAKSGPLPTLGVAETDYPFQWDGWMSNHMLLQLMKTESQTQMWIPTPGMGLKDYTNLTQLTPIAFGPTVMQYSTIINDLMMMMSGNDKAYYQRTVGPYDWQQQGEAKILNHTGNIFGLRGVTMEPILGVQKSESVRTRQ